MTVFTVTKPGGTRDYEFVAYTRLLEETGIDVTDAPRTPEPGTLNRWLHVWKNFRQAESFARELRARTHDPSWSVREVETEEESRGPVAPLDIGRTRTPTGFVYWMDPKSLERIRGHFAHARLTPEIHIPTGTQRDYEQTHGPIWDHVATSLTGLTEDELNELGGYRIFEPGGTTLHEPRPLTACRPAV